MWFLHPTHAMWIDNKIGSKPLDNLRYPILEPPHLPHMAYAPMVLLSQSFMSFCLTVGGVLNRNRGRINWLVDLFVPEESAHAKWLVKGLRVDPVTQSPSHPVMGYCKYAWTWIHFSVNFFHHSAMGWESTWLHWFLQRCTICKKVAEWRWVQNASCFAPCFSNTDGQTTCSEFWFPLLTWDAQKLERFAGTKRAMKLQ